MLSKKEIKIFEEFQFFDNHRRFPFEKKRINFTIEMKQIMKLKKISESRKESMSKIVNNLIRGVKNEKMQ